MAPGLALVVLVAGVSLVLSGCAKPTPLPPRDAVARYDKIAADLKTALAPLVPSYAAPRQRGPAWEQGACTYTAGHFDPDPKRPGEDVFTDPAWPDVKASLNQVLTTQGFGALGEPQRAGSGMDLFARDAHGAAFHLTDDGYFGVYGALADTSDCTRANFGLD
ncbi:MAG: hypothetical protein HZY73_01725 [Micropruina sp.]|nr:MAG: hypothetical protein HZY73_01725 [Micropruina sp.]